MKKKPERVTVEDVAYLAGVTKASVSRVLNNKANVSLKTRQKIIDAIQKLGYRPNFAARTLSLQRHETIGLIYESEFLDSYGVPLLAGVLKETQQLGMRLSICEMHGYGTLEDIANLPLLKSVSLDGVILDIHTFLGDLETLLKDLKIPYILVNPKIPRLLDTIIPDDTKVCQKAVEFLYEMGHHAIGYVPCFQTNHASQYARMEGYLNQMGIYSIKPLPFLRLNFDQQGENASTLVPTEDNFELVRHYINTYECTALITYSYNEAAYVYSVLNKIGFSVPERVSLLSCDYHPVLKFMAVPLTAMHFDRYKMGVLAVDMLRQKLLDPGKTFSAHFVEPVLILGRSVAKR